MSRPALVRAWLVVAALSCAAAAQAVEPSPPRTLRYAFRVAETGFDPAQISDLYSRTVTDAIFDAPLRFEFLARPVRATANTLTSMPEVSADFKTFTFHVRPGIHFNDDPAFQGQPRELVAADYVYAWKRIADPRWKSPSLYLLEGFNLVGLMALRREAIATGKPFDYDREVPGLRVLDRYTFQLRTAAPMPRLLLELTDGPVWGAVAREVVEAYGDAIMAHPVGTGAFKLGAWRRASKIVLERNPGYREQVYDEQPPAGDAAAQAIAAQLKGRRMPMLDRVEISIIDENQPRWLAFLNGEHDLLEEVPAEFVDVALPNDALAPNLARRGISRVRYARADVNTTYFNMDDPVVGGYTPEQVALRRAIALAVDVDKEIRLVRRGQAVPAQGPIPPPAWGFEPGFRSEMGQFDPARARALLDLYGYMDRNGDGWRERPGGEPLRLRMATQPDQQSRALAELWKKNLDAIGIRIEFQVAKWPENLKASSAGRLMMWSVGWNATTPDGDTFLALGYGPSKGQSNRSRFDLPAFNALYDAQKVLPDGPQRQALMTRAQKLIVAYAPFKAHVHSVRSDLAQPWLIGYQRNIFMRQAWKWFDIDPAAQAAAAR